jgi:hypothetical protein
MGWRRFGLQIASMRVNMGKVVFVSELGLVLTNNSIGIYFFLQRRLEIAYIAGN